MTMTYSTIEAEGGTIIRPFPGHVDSLLAKTKAALVQIVRCGQCKGSVDPETLLCSSPPESDEAHDSLFVADADMDRFEEILGFEKRREKDQKRTRRRSDAKRYVPGFYTKDDVAAIRDAQHGECYYCRKPLTRADERRDHMTPVAAEGSEWPSNIALTCFDCNHTKSDRGAAAFWNHLRKSRGAAWVTKRQAACKPVDALKSKLTKQRKAELAEFCTKLQHKLNDGVRELGVAGKLPEAEYVDITVEHSKDGIDIDIENVSLRFPPSAHRRVKQWATTQWPQILKALLELESAMGTITLREAEFAKAQAADHNA